MDTQEYRFRVWFKNGSHLLHIVDAKTDEDAEAATRKRYPHAEEIDLVEINHDYVAEMATMTKQDIYDLKCDEAYNRLNNK
jgi:hypothetical protein